MEPRSSFRLVSPVNPLPPECFFGCLERRLAGRTESPSTGRLRRRERIQLLQLTEVIDQDATVSHPGPQQAVDDHRFHIDALACSRDPEKRPAMSAGPSETAKPRFPNCFVTGEPMGEPAQHRRRAYRHPADRALCLYSATPSLTCPHTMRAVPLSLKISPLKRNTFPGAIALEFSICVLLST